MNSVPVSFGAVGTPTWFGFANLGLSDADLLEIGRQTALIHTVAGLIIPILALRFIVSWQQIRQNLSFILLSVLSCTLPYLLLAQVNYEFPALLGGAIGLTLSVLLARANIGLTRDRTPSNAQPVPFGQVLKAMSAPISMHVTSVLNARTATTPASIWPPRCIRKPFWRWILPVRRCRRNTATP